MLLFADSFEHYGATAGGRTDMLSGWWTQVDNASGGDFSVSTSQHRTGAKSLKFSAGGAGSPVVSRFSLGGSAKFTCGIGAGIYFDTLPTSNDRVGIQFRDGSNTALLTICLQSDGSMTARKGDHTGTVIDISDTILQAGTFNHIECKATFDTVAGFVEIRVNGVTKLQIGSLNLGSAGCTQVAFMAFSGSAAPSHYWDDVFAWDDSGTYNNTFLGAQRILTLFPAADTAQADWLIHGAATGHACIDNAAPDGDTTYLSSAVVSDKSDFTVPTLPPETAEVKGVVIPAMARIDAAGIGNLKVSMKSGVSLLAGSDVPLTPGYTYYKNVFEYDPATSVAWTKAGFEAALVRVEKSL